MMGIVARVVIGLAIAAVFVLLIRSQGRRSARAPGLSFRVRLAYQLAGIVAAIAVYAILSATHPSRSVVALLIVGLTALAFWLSGRQRGPK
jgi:multisubunit Na+/H+ antiporter MnhC subunit